MKKGIFMAFAVMMLMFTGIVSTTALATTETQVIQEGNIKFKNKAWVASGKGKISGFVNGFVIVDGNATAKVHGFHKHILTYKGYKVYRVKGLVRGEISGRMEIIGSAKMYYKVCGWQKLMTIREFLEMFLKNKI